MEVGSWMFVFPFLWLPSCDLIQMVYPLRERSHIPPMEEEYHRDPATFKGDMLVPCRLQGSAFSDGFSEVSGFFISSWYHHLVV